MEMAQLDTPSSDQSNCYHLNFEYDYEMEIEKILTTSNLEDPDDLRNLEDLEEFLELSEGAEESGTIIDLNGNMFDSDMKIFNDNSTTSNEWRNNEGESVSALEADLNLYKEDEDIYNTSEERLAFQELLNVDTFSSECTNHTDQNEIEIDRGNPYLMDERNLRRRALLYENNNHIQKNREENLEGRSVSYQNYQSFKKTEEKCLICPIENCNKKCSKVAHLKSHLKRHSGVKPYVCTWKNCSWKFARSDELGRHRRSHLGIKPYTCAECGKSFGRSDHLSKHLKVHAKTNSKK